MHWAFITSTTVSARWSIQTLATATRLKPGSAAIWTDQFCCIQQPDEWQRWKRGYLHKKSKTRSHNLGLVVTGIWNGHLQNEGATLLELPGVATNIRALYQQSAVLPVCSRCISQELFSCWWNRYTCGTQSTWAHGTKNQSCLPRSCSRL